MKKRSESYRVVVSILFATLLGVGLLRAQPIYRWVGPHGTVHYADVPGSPQAVRINPSLGIGIFQVTHGVKRLPPVTTPQRLKHPPPKAKKIAGLTPAQAEALCRATRARYEKLRPVRRLQLYNPNGTVRYLTGEELVTYKERAKLLMERFCVTARQGEGGGTSG